MAIMMTMKNNDYIVNKADIDDFLLQRVAKGNQDVFRLLKQAVGKKYTPFLEYAAPCPTTSGLSCIHNESCSSSGEIRKKFVLDLLPEEFTTNLNHTALWLRYAIQKNAEWLKETQETGIPHQLTGGLGRVFKNAGKFLQNYKDHCNYIDGPESFTQILTFNMKGKWEGEIHETEEGGFQFKILEHFSGLHTLFHCDLQNNTVRFMGWRYEKTGMSHAKQLMANRLALYQVLGTKELRSMFGYVGAYAFARYGFVPEKESWDVLRENLLSALDDFCYRRNVGTSVKESILSVLKSGNPYSIWDLVDIDYKLEGRAVAFELMKFAGGNWRGTFNMNNAAQMTRMRNYIDPETLDAAMENARKIMNAHTPVQKSSASASVMTPVPV